MSLFSVNTNLGALAALQSLNSTQQQLNQAQKQVSTGLKVGSASDNPAIYAISNTINSNIAGLSAVSDSLNFGAQIVTTASNAIQQVTGVLGNLQQTVTNSGQTGLDLTTLQNLVKSDLTQINQFATQSTFTGVNLLTTQGDGATSTSANIVQGLDGSTFNVANQATTVGGAGAQTLTDALGLTGLDVAAGGSNRFRSTPTSRAAASLPPQPRPPRLLRIRTPPSSSPRAPAAPRTPTRSSSPTTVRPAPTPSPCRRTRTPRPPSSRCT